MMKTTRKQRLITSLLFAILMLSGCAKYKVQKIKQREKTVCLYEEQSEKVDIYINAINQKTFKQYLKNYQPLHIKIKNKTDQIMSLSAKDISLQIESDFAINKTEPKLFIVNFLPCVITSALGFLFWWEFIIPGIIVFGAGGWQLSLKQNEEAQNIMKQKMLNPEEEITISPYSETNALIFVKKENYEPRFKLTIVQDYTNRIPFNVIITARTKNAYRVI